MNINAIEFSKMQIDNANAEISDAIRQDLKDSNISCNPDGTVTMIRESIRRFKRWTNWRKVFRGLEEIVFSLDLDSDTRKLIQNKICELIESETKDNGIIIPEVFLVSVLRDEINQIEVSSKRRIK